MKISNKIKLASVVLVAVMGFTLTAVPVSALTCPEGWVIQHGTCILEETDEDASWKTIQTIANWMFAIIGATSFPLTIVGVVLTIIGAKKQSKIKEENKKNKDGKQKKNGMLITGIIMLCLGVVGLPLALFGSAIVNFVFDGVFA